MSSFLTSAGPGAHPGLRAPMPIRPTRERAAALLRKAAFQLDARRTPGSPASGNTIQDLSANALRTANGSTGNAKIVQDGRGGKALRLHGGVAGTTYAQSGTNVDMTGNVTQMVHIRLDAVPASTSSVLGDRNGSASELSLRISGDPSLGALFYDGTTAKSNSSSYLIPTDGTWVWLALEKEVTGTGTAGDTFTVRFYYSLDGSSWSAAGADYTGTFVTGEVESLVDSLRVGAPATSTICMTGLVGVARVYDGHAITDAANATLVADFDPSRDASFTSLSWTSATTGETWTVTPGGADTNDVLFLPFTGERYVYLPGIAANYLQVTNTTNASVSTQLQVVYCVDNLATTDSFATPFSWSATTPAAGVPGFLIYHNQTTLIPRVFASDNVTVVDTGNIGASPPAGTRWWRVTWVLSNAGGNSRMTVERSSDLTSDAALVSWTSHGTWNDAAPRNAFTMTSGAACRIGQIAYGISNVLQGSFRRCQVLLNGSTTPFLDWSASDPVNATHTSFTAATGQTVTVNRSTSGRKTVVVEANKWLLGTDDYIEVADNDLLDMGAGQAFTVLAVYRRHNTQASYVGLLSKSADISNPALPGWGIRGSALNPRFGVTDGSVGSTVYTAASLTETAGNLYVTAGVQTGAAARYAWMNGTATATETTSLGSFANATSLFIGRSSNAYLDGELYAVYIWREALTASELAAIAADWGAA